MRIRDYYGNGMGQFSEVQSAFVMPKYDEMEKMFVKRFSGCRETIIGYAISDVGRLRRNNEDNFVVGGYINDEMGNYSEAVIKICKNGWNIVGVFDGMGGGDAGELAALESAKAIRDRFNDITQVALEGEIDCCMRKAFLEANNRIIDLQKNYSVFGTTATIMVSDGNRFKIYHMGDSRAYLFRDNELLQITRDQTLAQLKIDSGIYGPENPEVKIDTHKLTEFLGRDATKENTRPVESQWITLRRSDIVILCSDGLYDMCSEMEIEMILRTTFSAEEKCRALVATANENGGADNITCIVIC